MTTLADRLRGIVAASLARSPSATPLAVPLPAPPGSEPSRLSLLGGEWRGAVFVVEQRVESSVRHGLETVGAIADRVGGAAAEASWFAGGAPARAPFVFFDLETTGLSGGAGTVPFLVGCGAFDDRAFVVRQFLVTAPRDEKALLGAVGEVLAGAGALVTFNGKSFDAPLLETRYLFHRLAWAGADVPHVDVLHPARRFWSVEDCSLRSLERRMIGARRVGDVAGFEIPSRYFQFLRTGDARPLAPVLEHNRLDLLSLAALTSRLLHLARCGSAEARTSREALALGHVFARAGMDFHAREAFERSLALCAAPAGAFDPTRIGALRALALAFRRGRQFDRAAEAWTQVLQVRGCPPRAAREASEALAIHHEHRLRDLAGARTYAGKMLDVEPPPPAASWTRAVHHRLARLDRKMTVSAPPTLLS